MFTKLQLQVSTGSRVFTAFLAGLMSLPRPWLHLVSPLMVLQSHSCYHSSILEKHGEEHNDHAEDHKGHEKWLTKVILNCSTVGEENCEQCCQYFYWGSWLILGFHYIGFFIFHLHFLSFFSAAWASIINSCLLSLPLNLQSLKPFMCLPFQSLSYYIVLLVPGYLG